jgi:DNA invertase Pin-like site-specific DNA recombinase
MQKTAASALPVYIADDQSTTTTATTNSEWKTQIPDALLHRERYDVRRPKPQKTVDLSLIKRWTGCRGYVRFSTIEQEEKYSEATQRYRLQERAEKLGLPIVRMYVDAAVSGATEARDRPQLQRMFKHLRKGEIVLVVEISRLARDLRVALEVAKQIADSGCRLVSIYEEIDSIQENARFMLNMRSVLAEEERTTLRRRIKSAMQYKKATGEHIGRPPFGFAIVAKKLVPHPDQYPIVQRILEMRREGIPYEKIARALPLMGFKTRRGDFGWSAHVIRQICIRGLGKAEASACSNAQVPRIVNATTSDEEEEEDGENENQNEDDDVDNENEEDVVMATELPTVISESSSSSTPFASIPETTTTTTTTTTVIESKPVNVVPTLSTDELARKPRKLLLMMVKRKIADGSIENFTPEELESYSQEDLACLLTI